MDKKRDKAIKKMEKENEILYKRVNDIYQIIAKHGIDIHLTQEEIVERYEGTIKEILEYCLNENLPIKDVQFLLNMDVMITPIRQIISYLSSSVVKTIDYANEKKWGKKQEDVTFKELDEFIKE